MESITMKQPFTFSSFFLFLLSTFLSLFLIKIVISKLRPKTKTVPLPPGPLPLPIIGNLHLLTPPIHRSTHRIMSRYGPLISLKLGSTPCVVVGSADIARELLFTHDAAFSQRHTTVVTRKLAYQSSGYAFAPYGPYWRYMKRVTMSELLGPRTLGQLHPIRQSELLSFLRNIYSKSRLGEEVDVGVEAVWLTNNIITRMVASTTAKEETQMARKVVKQVAELIGTFNLEDFIGLCKGMNIQRLNSRIQDVHENFDKILERMMQQKEKLRNEKKGEEKKMKDLLDILLDVASDTNAEMKISREHIKGFLVDIITGGSDSASASIEWTLSELINHPNVLKKLTEEIDRVVGKDRLVKESDLPNLPYLDAVIKEIMRLHPAVALPNRVTKKDIIVSGYRIPANTSLFVNIWSIGRDPKYWVEPDEFRPERFLEEPNIGVDMKGFHYQLLPFGTGMRVCPGLQLALQVVPTALAALVQCFEWKVNNGPLDMKEKPGLVVYRANSLVVTPAPRVGPSLLM
ncbi:hypothetical protein LUZ60_002424 [Juncus effusus]|nr:hypothetical protein LUZ60_002424 [Juncus effusus]